MPSLSSPSWATFHAEKTTTAAMASEFKLLFRGLQTAAVLSYPRYPLTISRTAATVCTEQPSFLPPMQLPPEVVAASKKQGQHYNTTSQKRQRHQRQRVKAKQIGLERTEIGRREEKRGTIHLLTYWASSSYFQIARGRKNREKSVGAGCYCWLFKLVGRIK